MRGLEPLSPAIFEAWNGLLEGALAVHDRFLALEVVSGNLRGRVFELLSPLVSIGRAESNTVVSRRRS